MNFIQVIRQLEKNLGNGVSKKLESSVLSLFFNTEQKIKNGFEQSELLALNFILKGEKEKAESILNITRNIPEKYNNILLLIILIRNQKNEETKRKITNNEQKRKNYSILPTRYNTDFTFEDYIKERFADIRLEGLQELTVLKTNEVNQLLQMIVSGIRTDYTTVNNGKIEVHTKIRFEHHTTTSSDALLKKFIDIGESRLMITKLLRHDSFSYEIRRHLTKFDAYISTLSNNSPTALLTKIRPFAQVFKWFIRLLSMKTFDDVHNELLLSSQTSFKADLALHLWSSAFEETARPLYNFAFSTYADEQPKFPYVFNPISEDCRFAGELLRFLRDAAPSHPILDLSLDFMEVFLNLENRIDEYKSRCNKIIEKNTDEWIDFHAHQDEIKYNEFMKKCDELREQLRQERMQQIENDQKLKQRKQEELEQLREEAQIYLEEKRRKEEEEEESKKKYVE